MSETRVIRFFAGQWHNFSSAKALEENSASSGLRWTYSRVRDRKMASFYREICAFYMPHRKAEVACNYRIRFKCCISSMHPVLLGILGYLIGEKNHIEVVMGQFEVDHGFIFFSYGHCHDCCSDNIICTLELPWSLWINVIYQSLRMTYSVFYLLSNIRSWKNTILAFLAQSFLLIKKSQGLQ